MDNRSALLNSALELFASKGYDAVGVQEIVDSVGVTKPTLYHYFGSKHGLFEALLGEKFGQLFSQVNSAAEYHGDLTLNLTRLAQALFEFARANPTFYRMYLAMWFAPQESEAYMQVSVLIDRQVGVIDEMFALAVKDHGNMRGRQRAYASTFIGMIHTYIALWLNGAVEINDALVYQVVHQFEHGIYS
jgi:AcrR family transcriptional regulator